MTDQHHVETEPRRRFQDKVALVTGAASGIGAEITRQLIAEGARVAALDLVEADFSSADASNGAAVVSYACDVSSSAQVDAAIDSAVSTFGSLDVVVNCAG